MKSAITTLFCLLACCSFAQKRAAIFHLDLKGNAGHVKPADINVHVRQLVDRAQYLDSNGNVSDEKMAAAFADKIDTNVAVNNDFAFSLRNLNTGAAYRISIYYKVPLDNIPNPEFFRMRAIYQELKVNAWTYEYRIPAAQSCRYDATLHNRTCPKCHRSDNVLPILYDSETLEDPHAPLQRTFPVYHQSTEGATDCDPNWYCSRDRITF